MVIRNYDPCISCATHFLRLNLTGDGGRPRLALRRRPRRLVAVISLVLAAGVIRKMDVDRGSSGRG
jgi:hypothetical protein